MDETARFISVEQLSFSFGDTLSFENWLSSSANPAIRRIPRNTLKRTIHKLVSTQKKELIKEFASLDNKVSLCSDIWSDHWQSCLGITCHWIDSAWNIQKRLLAYRCFNDPHTAQNISHLMFIILEEYCLTSKIFSIYFYNASANTCSINELIRLCQPSIGGRFFHIRCTCHILNLCVQDGLKNLEHYIQPIRSAILYLWTHPQVMKQCGRFCKINGMRPKRFARDVPTRWNSTYKQLLSTFEYKDLLCGFFGQIIQSTSIYLYSNQWNICTTICEILKVFNDVTDQISGVYYPTSHLVLTHLCNVSCTFSEHLNSNDPILVECILSMKRNWEKYFLNLLSLIAKEILACPVSTVAVEQAFSMGGNTLDDRRSSIRPKNLEAQCLLNDWSRAASRTQDIENETNDDEDTEGTSGTTTGGTTSECD
ncbi:hypothetical protein F511_32943 [Dorcoceras hygrometricum]|uniref:HAT C-terminal dimerisation domain-containing protein n=1 Tax=Dorcoceras hygrometricum TaxID=472368 RepID=A0A2Z7CYW1_9LAMI|nr:hypothetical protein F511_32943 [Dorcoceras hygrometricum]